jgi:serine/threonine protein kinase
VSPNNPERSPAGIDDPRVIEALDQYLAALESGEKVNRQAFLARHPEIAAPLAECLDGIEALHGVQAEQKRSEGSGLRTEEKQTLSLQSSPSPAPLGDFQIVREIGRGGMGVVYEAVQLSLGRRVALKVLPFAAGLEAKQLQRFKTEAHAAAQLHHTNIVPVYAVGVERGLHFYAMQLIQGTDLAEFITAVRLEEARLRGQPVSAAPEQPKGAPSGPWPSPAGAEAAPTDTVPSNLRARLSTERSRHPMTFYRTLARLVAQAAEGLDYAHGMGVIHRDVKPANLLVDERANVWLTDFGLAQLHTEVGVTQTGDLVGTLRYMSPEQASGRRFQIDHRTDVYSLGATLYELLTLQPIFDGTDRQTLVLQILYEEPRPPRSVDPTIPAELETIVLKALHKAPDDRYATARELADDLERFLRDEPIWARRATMLQRGRKWLRRHPAVPIAGTVLLVLLSACSLVAAWLVRGEQEKAQHAYQQERQRAREAEARFQLARRSVDSLIQLAEQELADNPQMQGLRKQLLEEALGYYQDLIEQRRDDPDAQAELTTTRERVRKIVEDLAVLQGAWQLPLLRYRDVLDDLGASEEQREKITQLATLMEAERLEPFRDHHRSPTPEQRQRFLELAREHEKQVADILNREQLQRLGQIALQLQGAAAFLEPEIATALKLTPEQKDHLRTIQADAVFGPPDQPHGGPRGPRPGDHRRIYLERKRKALTQAKAVLDNKQLKRWHDLTGEEFQGSIPFFPFPFHELHPGGPPTLPRGVR